MQYPNFLRNNSLVGICALSAGIGGKEADFDDSLKQLKNQGYQIMETKSVRNVGDPSNTAIIRANEFNELIKDHDCALVMEATGGDVQFETLALIDYEAIRQKPCWYFGYSDPTNLLYPITTNLDIATLYGFNAGSFKENDLASDNALNILKGNLIKQNSFDKYLSFLDSINDNNNYQSVKWQANKANINVSGRCLGGCLDCIVKLIGTKFDGTLKFIEKYQDDGIIWYFDNFALSAFNTYLTFLQFKYAGYFKNTKAIIIGRNAIENTNDSSVIDSYLKAYEKALGDIPFIYEADIGHSKPAMTMINGAILNLNYQNHQASLSFELKN